MVDALIFHIRADKSPGRLVLTFIFLAQFCLALADLQVG